MLLATSRCATPKPRRALAVDVDLQRREVQDLRDARIDHARDAPDHLQQPLARPRRTASKFWSWIWMSIGAGRPKLSTWLTMSAVWK